jgi:sugar fermentation stimulation protein A
VNELKSLRLLKPPEVFECIIQKRINRFTVEAFLNGEFSIIYLNNTGRLTGILEKNRKGYCIPNKSGRIRYRLIAIGKDEYSYLVDTSLQERAFLEAVKKGYIPWLKNCILSKRNYRIEGEVVDYAFNCSDGLVLVELKSAVMELPGRYAGYPDAPTLRARKQLEALARYVRTGGKGMVVFVAGIPLANGFKLYCGADRKIKEYIDEAVDAGVVFKSTNIFYDPKSNSVMLGHTDLPVNLNC